MTSLVFRNFYFHYYRYRFGLGFRLGFGLGLGLGFGLGLGLRISFFSLYYKMSARTERAPSLFLFKNSTERNFLKLSFSVFHQYPKNLQIVLWTVG